MQKNNEIKQSVFYPSIIIIGLVVIASLVNATAIVEFGKKGFDFILDTFGWLYQWVSVLALILALMLTFGKVGNIKLGGKKAKPKFSFMSWFALTLTGGVATGLITYSGVNEPIVYLSNMYGELDHVGIEAFSNTAAIFAIARNFYNWTYFPYAIYSISGVLMAYIYFNRGGTLSILSTLEPIFGKKVNKPIFKNTVDVLAIIALCLALAATMGGGITLIASSLNIVYGMKIGTISILLISFGMTFIFTTFAYLGLEKGVKVLANFTTKILYLLMIILFLAGPTLYIFQSSTAGIAYWLNNFWEWSLDPGLIGGDALVKSWTLFDWSMWIAFAPLMGIFFGTIAYGRTIRQFMIINFILPGTFSLLWISIWGSTSIKWELEGVTNITKIIGENGFVAGLWEFLTKVPVIGFIAIPIVVLGLVVSFATTADTMTLTIANMCTKDLKYGEEAPKWQKLIWGVFIGTISYTMVAFGGGEQGIDGVKYLGVIGGFAVFFIFIFQIMSVIKVFYYTEHSLEIEEVKEKEVELRQVVE